MKKNIFTVVGFALLLFGMSALVLSLVGVKFSFLLWIDAGGPTLGFVIRLLMIFGGVAIAWLANHNWAAEDEERDPYLTRIEKYNADK
jgi:uncharacterized membrane protein